MHYSCLLLVSAAALLAADISWKTQPVSQWTKTDAQQVLAASPWVTKVVPGLLPHRSEAQLRDAGRMGGGTGVGMGGLDASALLGVGATPKQSRKKAALSPVEIRWESALPVHTAEVKAGEDAPQWQGDCYAIAVYDIADVSGDEANRQQLNELKRTAFLRRDGKKDLRPGRVDVVTLASGLARIVYLFPRTEKIAADDKITFIAQIGRLYVSQCFYAVQMQFQGKLAI
jgi:hypothetical protein